MYTYVIEVTRTITETICETITVKAKSLAEAECKASDKLTDLIDDGEVDSHDTEYDDYRPLTNQSPIPKG